MNIISKVSENFRLMKFDIIFLFYIFLFRVPHHIPVCTLRKKKKNRRTL